MRYRLLLVLSLIGILIMGIGFVSAVACTDSDNGKNYNVQGTCKPINLMFPPVTDFCDSNGKILTEYFCDNVLEIAKCSSETITCTNACSNGACTTASSCDCTSGSESCDTANPREFLNCINGCDWDNKGEIIGKCGVTECNDGIDNDGDGKIDGLVEEPNPVIRFNDQIINTGTNDQGTIDRISDAQWSYRIPTPCPNTEDPILITNSLNPGDYVYVENISGTYSYLYNYPLYTHDCDTESWIPYYFGFYPPYLGFYNTSNGNYFLVTKKTIVELKNGFQVPENVDSLYGFFREAYCFWYLDNQGKCEFDVIIKVGVCKDGIDNDGDGKIDYCPNGVDNGTCDLGCASPLDDSELQHDPDCQISNNEGAINDCLDDQTIMKLSNNKNALGSLWNFSNYNYDVCYDQIFNKNYRVSNSHDCVGDPNNPDNAVLWLSSLWLNDERGTFASPTKSRIFNIPVCYGQLKCEFKEGLGYGDWWNADFSKRKEINITGASTSLTDFPIYLKIPYDSDMQNDYDDLRFILSGSELDYEIENYNANYAYVWVKIPTLETGTNSIYMYYGNPFALNNENSTRVWDSNYVGVWHMTEPNIKDSTKNNINGIKNGDVSVATGKIGTGLSFDGKWDYIDIGNIPANGESGNIFTTNKATLMMWVKLDNDPPKLGTYKGGGPVDFGRHVFSIYQNYLAQQYPDWNGYLHIHTFRNDRIDIDNSNFDKSQWHMLTIINKPGVNGYKIYQNKNEIYSGPGENSITLKDGTEEIGRSKGRYTYYFKGIMDELRISNTSRSQAYIDYSYDIINNPTLVTIGNEENEKAITKNDFCPEENKKLVVRLKDPRGGLVSNANDANYNYGICCEDFFKISSANWKNMKNKLINKSSLNALVKIEISGEGFSEKEFNYTIYKKCSGLGCIPAFFFGNKEIAQSTSIGYTTWRAGKKEEILEEGDYYFKAYPINSPSNVIDSRYINGIDDSRGLNPYGVLQVRGPEVNIPPVANITGPKDKQIYFLGENLEFTQNSYDDDDYFTYEWNLGNGEVKTGNTRTMENFNFNYSYMGDSGKGQKTIILTVYDERNPSYKDRDQISILIVNSTYILAYIDEPLWGEIKNQKVVNLDASSSYAVSVTTGADDCTRTIDCKAGNCPNEAKGCPPCYSGLGLSCPITVTNSPPTPSDANYDNIKFHWKTFDRKDNILIDEQGPTLGLVTTEFVSPLVGNYKTELTNSINPFSTTKTEFTVDFPFNTNPRCIEINNEDDKSYFNFISGGEEVSIGQSYWKTTGDALIRADDRTMNCYQENGVGNDNDEPDPMCCPDVKPICDQGECKAPEGKGLMLSCNDFTDFGAIICEGQASAAIYGIEGIEGECGAESQETIGDCTYYSICSCIWDNDVCKSRDRLKVYHEPSGNTYDADDSQAVCTEVRDCTYDFSDSTGNCMEEDYYTLKWTTEGNVPPCIESGSKQVECPNKVKLGFFGILNLIIAVLIIIIIYYVIKKKRLKKRTKKKK